MKRALLLLLVGAATVFAGWQMPEAQAHRWGYGYRGGFGRYYGGLGGYGFGYRTFYRPRISIGIGYGGFGYGGWGGYYGGFYRPYYRSYYRGYYPSYYSYPAYGYGYGGYGCAYNVPVAPLYVNAGDVYGPGAVKEFMGVDRDFALGALAAKPRVVDIAPLEVERGIVAAPVTPAEKIAASNKESRALAARFISFGDGQFGEQQYHSAAQRYRDAIEAAPDVADAHFRQGFAYIASNRPELAARAFERGLALDPLWVNSAFRIDDLYERNKLAKSAHIELLAKNALTNRTGADNFFLLGLLLHFDGQQERAIKFFKQAEKLTAGEDDHIQAFLVPPEPRPEDAV